MHLLLLTASADGYTRVSRYEKAALSGCVEILFEHWDSTESLAAFLESYRSTGDTDLP